jgi:hypothetical protein
MTGKKREELDNLITKYGGRCVDYGRKEGDSFDLNCSREAITLFLDSLTVLEIDWSKANRHDIGFVGMFTGTPPGGFMCEEGEFYIPRPAPAKLTDAEIEEKCRRVAINATMAEPSWSWVVQVDAAITAYLAEKARLESLQSE